MKLYNYQKQYLADLPPSCIMAADTGCFAKGTRVLMADMSYKNIEDIVAGDLVITSEYTVAPVEAMQRIDSCPKPMIKFTYEKRTKSPCGSGSQATGDNESSGDNTPKTITATYDHPFYDGSRFYPLYQLVWRDLETSQRLQLQLLCQQYGQIIDHTPSRGITSRDTETWERFEWLPKDGVKWQDGQGAPSGSADMDTEPKEPTVRQPQRRRPNQQSSGQPGMVQPETEQPTRLAQRTASEITRSSDRSQKEVQRPDNQSDMGLVGREDRQHAENRLAYPAKAIHGIANPISANSTFGTPNYHTEAVKISNLEILEAEPYYAITISGEIKTYIVETLPVHNTGKTVMALAHYDRHSHLKPLLVLAPASKVRTGDWEREAREYFGQNLPDMTIISYEKATRKASGLAYFARGKPAAWWMQYVAEHPEFVLICDEVHKAKNPQSLMGKGVYALATAPGCKQFIGLSATPLPNGWQDAANYGKIFGWWKNKTEFFDRHVITYRIPGQHWSKITGYRNTEELERLWRGRVKPLKKSQALDLPKLRYEVVPTPKPTAYDVVRKTRVYRAEELDNAPKLANGLRRTLIADRARWLADFLEGASGHTVIFYNYIEEREAILEVIPKEVAIYRQDGERHEVPPKPDWDKLPERSVTVAQYKSGGTGVEMTYADKLVYMSPTYSYADFMQSVGRVYRAGQTMPVTAYLMYTKGTIDADIWRCIRQKRVFDVELWAEQHGA